MKLIALFTLLALAIACAKEEAAPAADNTDSKPDTTKTTGKTAGDMKKAAENAGTSAATMRTVTLSIEGMT